jgi:hypothetical protein
MIDADGYRFARPHGNRIPHLARRSGKTAIFAMPAGAPANRVQIRFIAMLKLPFKFDRS